MSGEITGWKNRIADLFVDREFFMRSNGQVKFLTISAKLQRIVVLTVLVILSIWILATLFMAANQYSVSLERMALVKQEAKVQSKQERVAAYKDSIDDVAKDLSKRQDLLENTAGRYFNEIQSSATGDNNTGDDNTGDNKSGNSALIKKIGALIPEAKALVQIEARQIHFAQKITKMAEIRTKKAEQEIRKLGLNPRQFATSEARGGPYIPFFGEDDVSDPRFTRMAEALEYMQALENGLSSIPSAMPAAIYKLSSSFGYRRDPINGRGAMHSGLDFKAPYATPILAAADGIITKASWQGGYGKTIEITHGNGLMTRYAHMSRLDARIGQRVKRGVKIGRMGSTGRSTGTHLHFEVRHHGRAINPRKFLKANTNVLKVKTNTNSGTKDF